MHRINSMSVFRLSLALTIATAVISAGCGDSEPSSNADGGVDGDVSSQDARVDNGPLDCGVRPSDGSVCITGRLYDFQTHDDVTPGVENEVFSFYNGVDMIATRDSSDTFMGRVAPNGRFMTWTNGAFDQCLALTDDIDGHHPATINCFSDYVGTNSDSSDNYRFYLVADASFSSWNSTYPGEPDLQADRPLILGQCRTADWASIDSGEYIFFSHVYPWPWPQYCYPFSQDRLSFFATEDTSGPIQPGGAFLYYVPLEFNGDTRDGVWSLQFHCNNESLVGFELGRYETEQGGVEIAILNNVLF